MDSNKKSLSQWVETYTGDMYSWALHKVSDSNLAQDLVQDTFLAAAEKIEKFKGDSSPKTWLFSILNHKIIDVYRKKVKQNVSLESHGFLNFFNEHGEWKPDKMPKDWQEDEGHLLDNIDFQSVLSKCLDALPDKWNICMKMKYIAGKNGKEICKELDVTPTNFWQMVHRAKLQLRDCVELNWFNN